MDTPARPTDRRAPTTVALIAPHPGTSVSGGHRYNAQLSASARQYGFEMAFCASFRHRPPADIVVVDSLSAWKTPRRARRRSETPVVALVHQQPGGVDGWRAWRLVRRRLDVATYRACEAVLASSTGVAAQLADAGVDPDRIVLVRPGCDLAPGPSAPPLRGDRRLGLLNVANWLPNKGIVELLDAMVVLPPDAATLHLVGSTDVDRRYASAVTARLAHPALADRVIVHGQLPSAQVAAMYRAADAFVFPSRHESYGTVAAEALAAGVPVVGWRSPHLTALVDDGVDGLLVERGDVGALAAAIRRLGDDEALRTALRNGARETGRTLPTWSDTVSRFFGVLTQLVAVPVEPADHRSTVDEVDAADGGVLDPHPPHE